MELLRAEAVAEVTRGAVILNLLPQLGVPAEWLARGLIEHPVISHAARLGNEYFPSEAASP